MTELHQRVLHYLRARKRPPGMGEVVRKFCTDDHMSVRVAVVELVAMQLVKVAFPGRKLVPVRRTSR